jgi:hypothetical protein
VKNEECVYLKRVAFAHSTYFTYTEKFDDVQMVDFDTRQWKGTLIERRCGDGFLNATMMCKANGREWFNYNTNAKTMAYKAALERALNVTELDLIVHIPRSGTWIHPRIAIDLARWCSPGFAVWLEGWIIDATGMKTPGQVSNLPLAYNEDRMYQDQFIVRTETHLHEKVVQFIRKKYPYTILIPGLGETGTTSQARLANWRKGYQSGCPDLLIIHRHPKFTGMALEFKHPGGMGVTTDAQSEFMESLQTHGWLVMLSQSYDDIILAIAEYMRNASIICHDCRKCFTTISGLGNHAQSMHGNKKRENTPAINECKVNI